MQNTQKVREMLAQIGGACVQVTLGCEDAQHHPIELDMLAELEQALLELYNNAKRLREKAQHECLEDDASCDCSWHENLRHALANGGGVTQ